MTAKTAELRLGPNGRSTILLEGQDITHVVTTVMVTAGVEGLPSLQLGIMTMGGIVIPEALMDVMLIDSHDAIRLRDMLADAIIALETVMEAHDDVPTPELREQIDRWKRHQEFPDGEKLGRYIERMRDHDRQRSQ